MNFLISILVCFSFAKIQLLQSDGQDSSTHFDPYSKNFRGVFEYSGCDQNATKDKMSSDEFIAFAKKHLSIRAYSETKVKDLQAKLKSTTLLPAEKTQLESELKKQSLSFREFKNVKECTSASDPKATRQVYPTAVVVPFFDPEGESETCAADKVVKKRFNVTVPMTNYMQSIAQNNWKSDKIFFTDEAKSCLSQSLKESALCNLSPTKIKLNELGLDKSDIAELKVSDGKIYIGNHTIHYYDKEQKSWCTQFSYKNETKQGCHIDENSKKPIEKILPIQISREVDENGTKVRKVINLAWLKISPNGEAEIGKAADETKFEKNNASEVNKTKGYLKIQNVIKEDSIATQIIAYDIDGKQLRRMEIMPRHVLGVELEPTTCPADYCSPFSKTNLCQTAEAKPIDLNNAKESELCKSCRGTSTGLCGPTETKPKRFTKNFDEKIENLCKKTEAPSTGSTSEI